VGQILSITPKELCRIPEQRGFVWKGINGSHHYFQNPLSCKITLAPMHSKDLPEGTFYAILNQARSDKSDL
jgi:predicted RNA binding protein YcfA (HicA-like mRNA interferase family)